MSDIFSNNPGLFSPICNKCKHYKKDGTCKAFPKGIPEEILRGDFIHTKPFTGDHGIVFEPIKKKNNITMKLLDFFME